MDYSIAAAIGACPQCQRLAAPARRPVANLGDPEHGRPILRFAEWEVDSHELGGALGGYRALTALERFSGLRLSRVVDDHSSLEASRALVDIVIRPFGPPRRIYTDGGTEFLGHLTVLLRRLGVDHVVGLPAHHGATSRVERAHRDINLRLRHMYIANRQHGPASRTEAQRWLDIANSVANALPNEAGFSPHMLLTGSNLRLPITALVPIEATDIFDISVPDLAQDVRLHRASLEFLDEERELARKDARARSVKDYSRARLAERPFEPGTLVMARAPLSERKGSSLDKVLSRLEYTGVWRVVSHDRQRERVTLHLLLPAPSYVNDDAIDTEYEVVVPVSDVRLFGAGAHDKYDDDLEPLDLLHNLRWNAWHRQTLSSGDISTLSAQIKAAVSRLLTAEQRAKADAKLDKAIDTFLEREKRSALVAARSVDARERSAALLPSPPELIRVLDVRPDGTVVGEILPHPRLKNPVYRSPRDLSRGERSLLLRWFHAQDARRAAEQQQLRDEIAAAERSRLVAPS